MPITIIKTNFKILKTGQILKPESTSKYKEMLLIILKSLSELLLYL